ncbi:metal ABC transporter substrate-binding protein (plasmid) [Levilactobacillus brevis]|uniref:metal ABC transporter solute-binding protein n=1 Tax=Levilactobacillus brevis TaxID=1580 RepID=UPI000A20BE43|nr:metal ABC transporter solute-binding protein [Levilactobacillus brevis]ARN93889.1 metal ABC transporter substrate-binding protein [Levilactobacillus brevis]ARN96426.1 metal ABC transporter substrate-binding protein [Levilactobacillus brevis]
MFRHLKKMILPLAFLILTVGVAGCSTNKSTQRSDKINVVATTDFYGAAARAVLGNKGTVTSVINNPNVDPHDYEPTASVGKEVAKANIIVANGIGYDGWMDKLAKNTKGQTYIKVGDDLLGKKDGDNPHLWYRPTTMPTLVNQLAKKYAKLQPNNKEYFKQNAKKYISSLKPVDQEINKLKNIAHKQKNKAVYVSEPVFDYALEAMGFKVANHSFEEDTENDVDYAPKTIKQMQAGIENHKISLFVFNKQVDSKTVNNFVALAKKNKIPVLPVTETLPKGENYKTWMLKQYKQLYNILRSNQS